MNKLNKEYSLKQLFSEGGMSEEEKESYFKWYKKEGYITAPRFKTQKDLLDYLEGNVYKAFKPFCERYDLPEFGFEIKKGRHENEYRLQMIGVTVPKKEIGIFSKCFETVEIGSFGGGSIQCSETTGVLYFAPGIWYNIHLSYKHIGGGTNGSEYFYAGKDTGTSVVYSIIDNKVYTRDQYFKSIKN